LRHALHDARRAPPCRSTAGHRRARACRSPGNARAMPRERSADLEHRREVDR
jgi:hypothetical protein